MLIGFHSSSFVLLSSYVFWAPLVELVLAILDSPLFIHYTLFSLYTHITSYPFISYPFPPYNRFDGVQSTTSSLLLFISVNSHVSIPYNKTTCDHSIVDEKFIFLWYFRSLEFFCHYDFLVSISIFSIRCLRILHPMYLYYSQISTLSS